MFYTILDFLKDNYVLIITIVTVIIILILVLLTIFKKEKKNTTSSFSPFKENKSLNIKPNTFAKIRSNIQDYYFILFSNNYEPVLVSEITRSLVNLDNLIENAKRSILNDEYKIIKNKEGYYYSAYSLGGINIARTSFKHNKKELDDLAYKIKNLLKRLKENNVIYKIDSIENVETNIVPTIRKNILNMNVNNLRTIKIDDLYYVSLADSTNNYLFLSEPVETKKESKILDKKIYDAIIKKSFVYIKGFNNKYQYYLLDKDGQILLYSNLENSKEELRRTIENILKSI
ncbi:hypothetical protein J6Y73_02035 [bacterium]|nr:hypothetical protein [bacterium]